ncbi:helix-turn-helix domain-containing protein [Halochromatium sp.]
MQQSLWRSPQSPSAPDLAEVAFLTGFAEQSGFTRAFKRWAGQTPRSYRLGARTPPVGT